MTNPFHRGTRVGGESQTIATIAVGVVVVVAVVVVVVVVEVKVGELEATLFPRHATN
jgi:hypothetical protein